jgi:hypothetical protein
MVKHLVDKEHSMQALKEMLKDKKAGEPAEEVLAIFCQRYSLKMDDCRSLYAELVKKGELKEK